MVKEFTRSTLAGLLVAIAAGLLVKVGMPLGGLMFPLALIIISAYSLTLFTGWVSVTWDWLMLAGNLFGAILGGWLISFSDPALQEMASVVLLQKLDAEPIHLLVKGMLCGLLMCMAFFGGRLKDKLTVYLSVAGFVLAGFEHSIALAAYITMAGSWSWTAAWALLIVLAGNAIGARAAMWLMTGGQKDGN